MKSILAGVGVAIPDALWKFRLSKLKDMGANAYRCAHNPPSNEFLDACDSLGILVMDENRNFNVSDDYMSQLEWMINRDRNHPSIFLWSVFNEEPMQGTYQGYKMVKKMVEKVKEYDTTRPVTAAMNGGLFSAENVSKDVDVVGFNYQQDQYDKFHAANPFVPQIISALYLSSWRVSPFSATKPDATVTIADNDMNSWLPVKPGEYIQFGNDNHALYNTSFTMNGIPGTSTGNIILKNVKGKAEVWLNNKLIGTKKDIKSADITLPSQFTNGNYKLIVLIEAEKNTEAGLGGTISIVTDIQTK